VQQVESTTMLGSTQVVTSTSYPVDLNTQKGWYIDLTLRSGSRVISDPQLDGVGGLLFVVYAPNTDPCVGGGYSYLMDVNYATGGGFADPQLLIDPNQTGSVVGVSLGAVFASRPIVFNGVILTNTTWNGQNCPASGCNSVIPTGLTTLKSGRTAWGEQR